MDGSAWETAASELAYTGLAREVPAPKILPAPNASNWEMVQAVAYDPVVFGTLLLGIVVVALQIASGALIWHVAQRGQKSSLIQILGVGLGLGTLLSLIGTQIGIVAGSVSFGWTLPIVVALVILTWHLLRGIPIGRVVVDCRSRWIAVCATILMGCLFLIPAFLRTPIRGGYVSGSTYHGDLVFFEAVAHFVSRVGPSESTLLAGHGIRYHWFAYGWIGSTTDVIGADPFVVMTRIFPVVIAVGAALLSVAWSGELSSRKWTPLLAGLLVVVAGFVGAEQGVILNFDSLSTAYAAVLALAFALVLTGFLRSHTLSWPTALILAALAAGTMGSKGSQAVVVFVGVAAMAIAAPRMPRAVRIRVWIAVSVTGAAMFITYLVIFVGAARSDSNIAISLTGEKVSTFQGLDPFAGTLGSILGGLALVLAILPRWIGTAWMVGARDSRWRPETVFGVGAAVAGILPIFVLSGGTNAGWFAVAASPLLGVLSAVGLERSWGVISGSLSRLLILSALAAAVVNVAVFVTYALGIVSGAPVLWRGPVVAWIAALLFAVAIAALVKSSAKWRLRWLATTTTILVFASIGARFNGAAAWAVTKEPLTPAFERVIRWTHPLAEVDSGFESSTQGTLLPAALGAATVEPDAGTARGTTGLLQWSAELNEAALWLDPQVQPGELVAIDAPYLQPFLPVVTDLTMYVAGEPYMSGYTTYEGVQAAKTREDRVRDFLEAPSAITAQVLWADGVRWLWLQMTPQNSIETLRPWTSVARTSPQVTILHLNDPDANSE